MQTGTRCAARRYREGSRAGEGNRRDELIKRRDHGDETLAEIGRSYNVSAATISRLQA